MPTENRSSNIEMVSDSEMTECQFHNNCGGWCETRRELEHNLCEHCLESHDDEMTEPAQAQQPQVEPATPYGWHVEWADSGDHYLFTRVEKRIEALRLDSDVNVVELYTRPAPADPGEVERLRAQVNDWAEKWEKAIKAGATIERKLAERDALLAPISGWTDETRAAVLEAFQDELNESASYEWYDSAIADLMKLVEALSASAEASAPLPPVDGDLLPPVGSQVMIHLAREDKWVEHTVVGYYAWENLRLDPSVYRVFVRVRDVDGYLNARGLGDIRPVDSAVPQQ